MVVGLLFYLIAKNESDLSRSIKVNRPTVHGCGHNEQCLYTCGYRLTPAFLHRIPPIDFELYIMKPKL